METKMDAGKGSKTTSTMKNPTTMERKSDRELVVTRTFNGPARLVFDAWTRPELIRRWWTPKSIGITFVACEADVRTGGGYRFVFGYQGSEMAFFGKYLEVIPGSRLVWTNEEGGEGGNVTTVTFEDRGGETLVVVHELYPSKEVLDDAMSTGAIGWSAEQFEQLDDVLASSRETPRKTA
jgi:uncharacterized protein YndB with AHSA1/START domain